MPARRAPIPLHPYHGDRRSSGNARLDGGGRWPPHDTARCGAFRPNRDDRRPLSPFWNGQRQYRRDRSIADGWKTAAGTRARVAQRPRDDKLLRRADSTKAQSQAMRIEIKYRGNHAGGDPGRRRHCLKAGPDPFGPAPSSLCAPIREKHAKGKESFHVFPPTASAG